MDDLSGIKQKVLFLFLYFIPCVVFHVYSDCCWKTKHMFIVSLSLDLKEHGNEIWSMMSKVFVLVNNLKVYVLLVVCLLFVIVVALLLSLFFLLFMIYLFFLSFIIYLYYSLISIIMLLLLL